MELRKESEKMLKFTQIVLSDKVFDMCKEMQQVAKSC